MIRTEPENIVVKYNLSRYDRNDCTAVNKPIVVKYNCDKDNMRNEVINKRYKVDSLSVGTIGTTERGTLREVGSIYRNR